jgi:hypothetical protein
LYSIAMEPIPHDACGVKDFDGVIAVDA